MFNKGWVIGGIVIFVAVAAFPFYWYQVGRDKPFPQLELPAKEKKCVESVEFMRANHMRLLDAWRIAVVRDDLLIYTSTKGEKFEMNLHKTCMGCHTSRDRFCNQCHDYNNVVPPCWDCHFDPSETGKDQRSEVGVQPPAQRGLRPGGRSEVRREGMHGVIRKGDAS